MTNAVPMVKSKVFYVSTLKTFSLIRYDTHTNGHTNREFDIPRQFSELLSCAILFLTKRNILIVDRI